MVNGYGARVAMIKAWAEHDADTFRAFLETVRGNGIDPFRSRVLDVGCGANAPMAVLLHSAGATVTGIDAYVGHRWGLGVNLARYRDYVREAGVMRTLRKLVGEIVYDRHYYTTLARKTGLKLTERNLDLRKGDVHSVPIPDGSVDVVHSNATWEHIPDVAEANRQVARVLRPGGLAYIEIHLFPALSGGHDLPWIVPGKTELGDVRPWQHLTNPTWQAPVFLNRLRERDYERLFKTTPGLEIIGWQTEYTEGQQLLTEQIRAQLPEYTPEELTKRSIIVVARRV
ncbi:MAG TPA: class I SAM-dependent methyltransferase [Pyrinomonadaceae bacterium]|nr:class I SAM-dependent methyltransferase [Pyrinomonadaceae bacterium]